MNRIRGAKRRYNRLWKIEDAVCRSVLCSPIRRFSNPVRRAQRVGREKASAADSKRNRSAVNTISALISSVPVGLLAPLDELYFFTGAVDHVLRLGVIPSVNLASGSYKFFHAPRARTSMDGRFPPPPLPPPPTPSLSLVLPYGLAVRRRKYFRTPEAVRKERRSRVAGRAFASRARSYIRIRLCTRSQRRGSNWGQPRGPHAYPVRCSVGRGKREGRERERKAHSRDRAPRKGEISRESLPRVLGSDPPLALTDVTASISAHNIVYCRNGAIKHRPGDG